MQKKNQETDYVAMLQERHDLWDEIYKNGCSDPHWSDGANLNFVRNHIMYYRSQIEKNDSLDMFPDICNKEIPPEVDSEYMARSDEIRAAAKESLAKYMADENYKYIVQHQDDFSSKTKKDLCIDGVIGYATRLKKAIAEENLVTMRLHEGADTYLESFEDCARRMKETPAEEVQLTLFSLSASGLDFVEDEEFGGMEIIQ